MGTVILKERTHSVRRGTSSNTAAQADDVDLLQNVIHDLKMSLSLIYIDIRELEKSSTTGPEDCKHIKRIKKNYYRMMKLVNDTCDSSRIASGNFRLNNDEHDVVMLIKDIAEFVQGIAESRKIRLRCEFDVEEKIINFDAELFERILLNLISNAFKYTETGGVVEIIFTDLDDGVQIAVRDNGKGFDSEVLEYCFNRYITEHCERNSKGWGIGLSIVNQLVEIMGGEIFVRNLKRGAEVALFFPVTPVREGAPAKIYAVNDFYKDNMLEIEMSDM